jgi:sialic acid synthase SpsE
MLTINGVRVDDPQRPYIIAEAAGSHGQDYATAQNLVRVAADAGADAIKFQTFRAEWIAAPDIVIPRGQGGSAHDAWLDRLGVVTLRDLFRWGGLPREWHKPLQVLAADCGITFLSTPFSLEDARFLVEDIGVPAVKIASGDLTFVPLLQYADSTNLPLIVSTGGATFAEVKHAVFTHCKAAWSARRLVLMHCCSVYPAPEDSVNLRAIHALQACLCPVGYSDHTLSAEVVPALAMATGAVCLEKHLRLEGDSTTVDAGHSLTPAQFRQMVETVRQVPAILGDGIKQPHALEMHDRLFARRSPEDWLRPTQAAREGTWA